MTMTSSKPYLLRALHAWINDNQMTPHLLVNANKNHVKVPQQYVKDGQIVLNISLSATAKLMMDNDYLSFHARFSGVMTEVWVPMSAIIAIYTRESGEGMFFEEEHDDDSPPPTAKPKLTLVKG